MSRTKPNTLLNMMTPVTSIVALNARCVRAKDKTSRINFQVKYTMTGLR